MGSMKLLSQQIGLGLWRLALSRLSSSATCLSGGTLPSRLPKVLDVKVLEIETRAYEY